MTAVLQRLGKGAKGKLRAWDADRRRLPRRSVDWRGRYCFTGPDRSTVMGDCRIVDISAGGAGIEAFGGIPVDPVGLRVQVSVPCPGGSTGLKMEGVVRNVDGGRSGGVRIGIEFAGLSDWELVAMALAQSSTPTRTPTRTVERTASFAGEADRPS